MTKPSEASSTESRRTAWTGARTEIPMTAPLVPGVCPCGRPGGQDGFCDEHTGAVAFKMPLGPRHEVLPAVWWHWPHPDPCPDGEAWVITSAGTDRAVWACTHRRHDLSEAGGLCGQDDASEEATG